MKLKAQSNVMVLSYLWWVIEPLIYGILFYFIFNLMMFQKSENFFIFILIGKVHFLWFSKSVIAGANSIIENKGLISQRVIPKYVFPLVNCQELLLKQVISLLTLIAIVLCFGYSVSITWLQLVPLTLTMYGFICGISLIASVFVTYAQDFRVIIQMAMMGLMFTSGIFWDINMIDDQQVQQVLFTYNPLAALIDSYRQILLSNEVVSINRLVPPLIWAGASLLIGLFLLKACQNSLTRKLFL
ncbi:Teichoic acid translocation permease protein TagG [Pseudoalteromonas sp. P1-9]|nr:Teichoic acid translocation permease protein TagG [Pseudoalteromonas sp. P1-9]